jgi:hypothetical protein
MKKLSRLFQIKTRLEVYLITYALALGAVKRGEEYLFQYPGMGGKMLFLAATGAVFLAAAKMLQAVDYHNAFGVD